MKAIIYSASIIFAALFAVEAQALEIDSSKFMVNGFGTLGLTKGDNDRVSTRNTAAQDGVFDEWSAAIDSRIGIQADYFPTDKLTLSVQVVAADREENSLNKSVHSAYIGYKLTPSLEIKVGRIATQFLMLSEYKHVGYAQLWAHPSLEFYGQSTSDYGDGLALIYDVPVLGGHLRTQAWVNSAEMPYFTEKIRAAKVEPSYGLLGTWEGERWTYSFAYASLDFDEDDEGYQQIKDVISAVVPLWPESEALIDQVTLGDTTGNYYGFAVGYNDGDWILRTELSLAKTEAFSNDIKSAYVLAGRKFNSITPYVIAAAIRNDRSTIPAYNANPYLPSNINSAVSSLQEGLQQYADLFHYDQQTLSLGARWDIKPKIALKAQWDHSWISAHGNGVNQQRAFTDDSDIVNRFTVTMDFIF